MDFHHREREIEKERIINQYKEEDAVLGGYEGVVQLHREETATVQNMGKRAKGDYALGYRYLNKRLLDLEDMVLGQQGLETAMRQALTQKADKYERKKNLIEDFWHKSTAKTVEKLEKEAPHDQDSKTKVYYEKFSLKEMEDFLKNSDRGGNSIEYNSVVTDLELYNRIKEIDPPDSNEELTYLKRLKESVDHYLLTRSKSPWSSSGKRRRAMIEQISERINAEVETRTNKIWQDVNESYAAYENDTESVQKTHKACKAHYDLMYHVLKGNISLHDEKKKDNARSLLEEKEMDAATLDERMARILDTMSKQEGGCDSNQSNNLCTKFFNAIGWADHKPTISEGSTKQLLARSSLKNRLAFHCISPTEGMQDAKAFARQFIGKGNETRQYLGDGALGHGTYLGVAFSGKLDFSDWMSNIRSDLFVTKAKKTKKTKEDIIKERKEEADRREYYQQNTLKDLWDKYGSETGSVQLSMCFNANMRLIDKRRLDRKINRALQKFAKTTQKIKDLKTNNRQRPGEENLPILAALLGYNTIAGGERTISYDSIVNFDRKALTILGDFCVMRQEDGSKGMTFL